ncbi:MAG TPA: DUF1080 domain-containing protein [bacterium]|nr:DUF1080 domain-containing protein [bacterium]
MEWAIHDSNRPLPPVVTPSSSLTLKPPSDATVLFDGTETETWEHLDGDPLHWKCENGILEVIPGTGDIRTKQGFGDCQLYVEWAAPVPPEGDGQDRGNSGVFLMGKYEVQILDSHNNPTYADGLAGAIYGQYPPLVNACFPPGEWQTYQILFHRPRFGATGKLRQPAHMTVLQNGILIQDHVELTGPTAYQKRPPYAPHPDALPLRLQDHGDPVRFRRIWIRGLKHD